MLYFQVENRAKAYAFKETLDKRQIALISVKISKSRFIILRKFLRKVLLEDKVTPYSWQRAFEETTLVFRSGFPNKKPEEFFFGF